MTTHLDVTLSNQPHLKDLKHGKIPVDGCDINFIEVDPIYSAFAPMVRELKYDVSELAIATALQARAAGRPVSLLPIALNGNFHHHSLTRWPGTPEIDPSDLRGKRLGVRAYSQTTGLWVRGMLSEDFGVRASETTWVTTEPAHVEGYTAPIWVEQTTKSLADLLREGYLAAAIRGHPSLEPYRSTMVPVVSNWREVEQAWGERHKTIPINHMVAVRTDLLASNPEAIKALYDAIVQGIDETLPKEGGTTTQQAVRYGLTDSVLSAVQIAIDYALEQEVLRKRLSPSELFADFERYIGA